MARPVTPKTEGPAPLNLLEEAAHLLRTVPGSTLATYYIGALPFGAGLLYFWADMSRGAYADQRCAAAALGLALLFGWMVSWQAVFVQRLRAHLSGAPPAPWTWTRLWRMIGTLLALIPPTALSVPLAKPVSFAFYQSLLYVADGETADLRQVTKRAGRLALLWIMPGYVTSWAIWGFGLFVFLNLTSLLWALPLAAKTVLGLDSAFSRSTGWMFSSTLWAIAGVLSYLCVNPLTKAVFALRCFYGESIHSAADLRADLRAAVRNHSTTALLLGLVLGAASLAQPAVATEPAPVIPASAPIETTTERAAELDQSIQRTLQKPRYLWRLPREKSPKQLQEQKNWLSQFVDDISDWISSQFNSIKHKYQEFLRRLARLFRNRQQQETASSGGDLWTDSVQTLVLILVGLLVAVSIFLLWGHRARRRSKPQPTLTTEPAAVPDVADENVRADQLPEDGWLARARELLAAGEQRLAVRALHLATLAHLAGRELITIARYKSEHDYEREVGRRARGACSLQAAYSRNRQLFESVWYGTQPAQPDLLDEYQANLETIRRTNL